MIAARQEIELRPQLERLDRLLLASVGVAPGALSFTFRPLWQMDAATKAATALQKAQATSIYAGLGLWPKDVMAGLVAGQLAEDGIDPDAGAAFEAAEIDDSQQPVRDSSPDQPRDPQGRWTEGGGGGAFAAAASASLTPNMGKPGAELSGQNGFESNAAVSVEQEPEAGLQEHGQHHGSFARHAEIIYICVGVEGGKSWRSYRCPDGSTLTQTGSDLPGFIIMPPDLRRE